MEPSVRVHAWTWGVLGTLGSIVNLGGAGTYFHWHFINISIANLIVIGVMVLAFGLAILLPFPRHRSKRGSSHG